MIIQAKYSTQEFEQLFIDLIKKIYWAERHLARVLPKIISGVSCHKISHAIYKHLEDTQEHVNRLEEVFKNLQVKSHPKKCHKIEGLLKEARTIIDDTAADSMLRDADIIIASQRVLHYKISSYGSLVKIAVKMEIKDIAEILIKTLDEERETDSILTRLAISRIQKVSIRA
ncbi:ferritin-like metal-binding protein YciE [Algoriphagus antarcticus]|uniref:Ferritin-like metal-binding protein YciE n=2 Tax=Algoriphagus antarcticus TaxID=238540 RepID=A0A3E0DXE6_9BACT|nr:ferritin-like metal-binding protein YciE [Algoriphagus antarcticus]